jgi:DNA-binding response OmpR family regulator/TolB-like protein
MIAGREAAEVHAPVAGPAEMAAPGSLAVLVVEDDGVLLRDLRQSLADLGCDAIGVASTDEAMAQAAERLPDLALVEIGLETRHNGVETAQTLRERLGVPIVYVAGRADDATLQRALRAHRDGYLVKPVGTAELWSAIRTALSVPLEDGEARLTPIPVPAEVASPATPSRDVAMFGPGDVRQQLERVLGSSDFDAPRRSREFLRFVVKETLAGRGETITQGSIAAQVFGRKDDFDATVDPIVRIQAGRLRHSLERYYLLSGKNDMLRIRLPRGTYVPTFSREDGERSPLLPPPVWRQREDGWPFLAVAEFEAVGSGSELAELAFRTGEEIGLELGRYHTVRVLSHRDRGQEPAGSDGARFVLGGRLRAVGEDVRVTARLVDRTTGEQLWGDEYHTLPQPGQWGGALEDIARVIAARVGSEEGIVVQLLATERRNRRPSATTAYDAMLLAYDFLLARNPDTLAPAIEALRRVVESQPECGPAWGRLARLYLANHAFEVTSLSTPIDEAITCAHNGVRVDPSNRGLRCALAAGLLIKGELAAGRDEAEQALHSSPGSLVHLDMIGFLLTLLGDWERGSGAEQERPRTQSALPALRRVRDLGRSSPPGRRRAGIHGRLGVPGSDVLLETGDARLLPRPPRPPRRGRVGGGRAAVLQAGLSSERFAPSSPT